MQLEDEHNFVLCYYPDSDFTAQMQYRHLFICTKFSQQETTCISIEDIVVVFRSFVGPFCNHISDAAY